MPPTGVRKLMPAGNRAGTSVNKGNTIPPRTGRIPWSVRADTHGYAICDMREHAAGRTEQELPV